MRGCQERKGFCPLTTHKVSTTPPSCCEPPRPISPSSVPTGQTGKQAGAAACCWGFGGLGSAQQLTSCLI